jgi:hypothetical protein
MIMIGNTNPAIAVTWRCVLDTANAKLAKTHYRLLSKR